MIEYAKKEWNKEEIESLLNPFVRRWFSKFRDLTPPQKFAVKLIHERKNTLISSPTGSGKTVSAFLSIINELFNLADSGELEDTIYCLYVSPLKALNNDIYVNLTRPLTEINEYCVDLPDVRVGVRTGDTTQNERVKQARKPPHILVTTPESFALILNSPKFAESLKNLKWLVVDEIHALCSNKRGVHLSLSVERLKDMIGKDFTRIGLSATISPLEEVAKYLVGENGECTIVDTKFIKEMDVNLSSPVKDLIHTPVAKVNSRFYDKLDELISSSKTSLLFTNTRSGTERILFTLQERFKKKYLNQLGAHHSSLSKEQRFEVENKLKNGELKCVCSSTSLELGIDIGYIDKVIQVASPKSISRLLQRIGRAGHQLHETSIGKIIVSDRDDLVECAVMIKEAYKGRIDDVYIPKMCLDVLAQHILGMALNKKWKVSNAFKVVKQSYCYSALNMNDFLSVIRYLAGKSYELDEEHIYGKIWYDPVEEMFGKRKGSRLVYYLNIGTIPDSTSVRVYVNEDNGDKQLIGSLDEEFVEKLEEGDRFVIGGKTYSFVSAKGMIVTVEKAWDKEPTIPSWVSEMLPLSFDLSIEIGKFREKMFRLLQKGENEETVKQAIQKECKTDSNAAEAIFSYFKEQYNFLKHLNCKIMPSHENILIENYWNDNKQNIIFHTLYGRRVNDVLSRVYAHVLSKSIKRNISLTISDNGFMLSLPEKTSVSIEELIDTVKSTDLELLAKECVEKTEIMKRRFRHVASRGLMILKNYRGNRISVNKQQISAGTLLKICLDIKDFPLIKETFREILYDAMDLESAKFILNSIETKRKKIEICRKSTLPSPFAHNLVLRWQSDILNAEGKRELLERLHSRIIKAIENK